MNKQSFKVRTDFIDLLQLLKATGYAATGGEAKMMVEDGLISVNNELELRKRRKLRPGDEVQISDEILIALS